MAQATCAVEACERPVVSRGWCSAHYQRWLNDGDPGAGRPLRYSTVKAGACAVPGCDAPEKARGWCGKHYGRLLRHGDPLGGAPERAGKRLRPCAIDECANLATGGHGWCKRHYQRWHKYGDPLAGKEYTPRGMPLRERIEARVAKAEECWFWLGSLDGCGYGMIAVDGRAMRAHRASYEAFVAPIPEGLVIDHLCRNRACVNPAHLEPVPHEVNVRRGASAERHSHCHKGHEFTEENTLWRQVCATCDRENRRRYRAKRKQQPKAA